MSTIVARAHALRKVRKCNIYSAFVQKGRVYVEQVDECVDEVDVVEIRDVLNVRGGDVRVRVRAMRERVAMSSKKCSRRGSHITVHVMCTHMRACRRA